MIVLPERTDNCEICGKNLKLITDISQEIDANCFFCRNKKKTNILCPDGHYICDECHSKDAIDVITDFCLSTSLEDPFEIADEIMKHPNFKVYGPEHHALVPAAVLTSLKNLKIKNPSGEHITDKDILLGIQRGRQIPGGWCGFYGTCGAGVGSGVTISVFARATPSTDKARSLANLMTSWSLMKIADDLEHCCKRSVRLSIIEILKFLNEKFALKLNFKPKVCIFHEKNSKCEHEKCPFFSKNKT